MSRKLVISDGARERELQLVGRLVVGRDPSCDISDDHSLLSRRHAEFVTAGAVVTVRDLGSRNGVFVNGSRAAERSLEPGDVVQIGPLRARYVVDEMPISITPESLDADRTAMLRKPDTVRVSHAAPAPAGSPAAAPALADTVVPLASTDEDVTRMVPAPVRQIADTDPGSAPADEEVTRFTPGPGAPDFAAAVLRPVPASAPAGAPVDPPTPRPAASAQSHSTFVLIHVVLLAAVAVFGTLAAASVAPGLVGALVALLLAVGAAVMVARLIDARLSAAERERS